jgi:radical SAM protein with 4Fe4S-binding SPASM domain
MVKGEVVNFEKFKYLFDSIIKANPLSRISPKLMFFDLTGIGENLMNKEFLQIIKYMKSKNVTITFATNATLLTEKISRVLIKNNIDIIFISIDGATKKTYEKIRKGANFDEVKANVIEFRKLKEKLKKNKPKLMIRFLASNWNVEEMPMMVDLAKELGVNGMSITNMNSPPEEEHLRANKERFNELANITKEKGKKEGLEIDIGFSKKRPINQCNRAKNSMNITCEGFVLPCCFINQGGQYKEIKEKYNFGNVWETNIKKIWNSKAYKKFRKDIKKGLAPSICKDCYIYYPIK